MKNEEMKTNIQSIMDMLWSRVEKENNAAKAKAAGTPTEDIEMAMCHEYAATALAYARDAIQDGWLCDE